MEPYEGFASCTARHMSMRLPTGLPVGGGGRKAEGGGGLLVSKLMPCRPAAAPLHTATVRPQTSTRKFHL